MLQQEKKQKIIQRRKILKAKFRKFENVVRKTGPHNWKCTRDRRAGDTGNTLILKEKWKIEKKSWNLRFQKIRQKKSPSDELFLTRTPRNRRPRFHSLFQSGAKSPEGLTKTIEMSNELKNSKKFNFFVRKVTFSAEFFGGQKNSCALHPYYSKAHVRGQEEALRVTSILEEKWKIEKISKSQNSENPPKMVLKRRAVQHSISSKTASQISFTSSIWSKITWGFH